MQVPSQHVPWLSLWAIQIRNGKLSFRILLICAVPVSYTHLLLHGSSLKGNLPCFAEVSFGRQLVRQKELVGEDILLPATQPVHDLSVSYTHLDVYKRQALSQRTDGRLHC